MIRHGRLRGLLGASLASAIPRLTLPVLLTAPWCGLISPVRFAASPEPGLSRTRRAAVALVAVAAPADRDESLAKVAKEEAVAVNFSHSWSSL